MTERLEEAFAKAARLPDHDDLRAEYDLDYAESRPNRFAPRMGDTVVTVVLEPDVAAVFDTSESVNRLLRSVIAALPPEKRRSATTKGQQESTA